MTSGRTLTIEIVLATGRVDDRETLAKLLAGSPWRLVNAGAAEEALAVLRRLKLPIILCDPAIAGDRWAEMLHSLLAARRGVYIVLLTDAGENLQFPRFDCLSRPLEREQVFRALFFAYARCKIRWPAGVLVRAKKVSTEQDEQSLEASVT